MTERPIPAPSETTVGGNLTFLLLWLLFTTSWTGFFAYMVFDGYREYRLEQQLQHEAVVVSGRVLSTRYHDDGNEHYFVTYQYLPSGASQPSSNEQEVSEMTYRQLEAGMPVDVIYLPNKGAFSRLQSDFRVRSRLSFVVPLCFVPFGAIFVILGIVGFRKEFLVSHKPG